MTTKPIPQPERLITCKGGDTFGDFTCVGKWVLYKGSQSGRFMRQRRDGTFEVDRGSWQDTESWEYLEEAGK